MTTEYLAWGFAVGMNVTIAGTDFMTEETEEFKILAVDTSNAEYELVSLDRAPSFRHIGASASLLTAPCSNNPDRVPDFRAEVTSWAKNVRIVGSNQEPIYSPLAPYHTVTDNNTDWGCTIVHANYKEVDVSNAGSSEAATWYFSESLMSNIEMYNCSQKDSQQAFVRYEGTILNTDLLTNETVLATRYIHSNYAE